MTDGLSLIELSGSDESEEISLQSGFVFPVQLGQRFLLSGRGVGIQLGNVTRPVAAVAPQRMQRILPRLGFVREKLHLFRGKRTYPCEIPKLL